MGLKVAIQMDPIGSIDIDADSTFVIALEAQSRGHRLWHYGPRNLAFSEGRVTARAQLLTVRREAGNHHTLGAEETIDLADMDVVQMRQDPPFDMGYITATHLLEHIHPGTLVVNDPVQVRNAPEKLFVTHFPDLMPPTIITSERDRIVAFREEHKDIIVKPLFGNGGAGVFHIGPEDENLSALLELFTDLYREPIITQAYLPEVRQGDKRIILIDGEPRRRHPASAAPRRGAGQHARRRQARESGPHRPRPGDLRRHRPGVARAWPDLRRHRRHRALPDGNQRHLAHRPARDQPLRRGQPGGPDLGRHRTPDRGGEDGGTLGGVGVTHRLASR